jgi:hypothetical protein
MQSGYGLLGTTHSRRTAFCVAVPHENWKVHIPYRLGFRSRASLCGTRGGGSQATRFEEPAQSDPNRANQVRGRDVLNGEGSNGVREGADTSAWPIQPAGEMSNRRGG